MEVFTVNTFTDKAFCGNPAAVCVVRQQFESRLSEAQMKAIAAELKLPETAFVTVPDKGLTFDSATHFNLRWFTEKCEVPLCGHGTVATAAIIFDVLGNRNDKLEFTTLGGKIVASKNGDYVTLDLPEATTAPVEASHLKELVKHTIGDFPIAAIEYSTVRQKLLIRLADDADGRNKLEKLSPNTGAMLEAPTDGIGRVKGVAVTVRGDNGYDFYTRYFGPWVGIPEDHVSAATHTLLANYWSRELGKKEMLARQCSPRGGELRLAIGEGGRVMVSGKVCIILQGKLVNF